MEFCDLATFQKMVTTEFGPSLLNFCVLASFSLIQGEVPPGRAAPVGGHPDDGPLQSYLLSLLLIF